MWSQIVVFYFVGLSFRHHLSCILGRLFFSKSIGIKLELLAKHGAILQVKSDPDEQPQFGLRAGPHERSPCSCRYRLQSRHVVGVACGRDG